MFPLAKTLLLSATLALSGCAGAVMIAAGEANNAELSADDLANFRMTFPVMMLLQPDDGPEKQFTGKFVGSVDGTSKFNLVGEGGVTCDGAIASDGQGTLNCSNGLDFAFTKAKPGIRMSGINFVTFVGKTRRVDGAFGWGNHANEAALRAALSEKLEDKG